MEKLRLDKMIASTGLYSRKEVKQLVRQGRVLADGRPVATAEEKFDPEQTELLLDGRPLLYHAYTYVMLHKPAGVLSATEDARAATVLSLLPPELRRQGLFPVGRLDKDSEGLLLLTNNGPLAHDLLSPRRHVDKQYFVRTQGRLEAADQAAFREGLALQGLACMPAELEILQAGAVSEALVTLREGKFHQVKRMLAARGKPVLYLKRIRMGNLTLDPALPAGAFRFLTDEELSQLKESGK